MTAGGMAAEETVAGAARTPAKICIFVSHRVDLDAETVENPLYVPVRCGAALGKAGASALRGDDTGENISDCRDRFGEFTVQYWAWHNVDADYYGLCHYRRYLCFAKRRFPTGKYNIVNAPVLSKRAMQRFGLLDAARMRAMIESCDLLTSEDAYVPEVETAVGYTDTVRALWGVREGSFFEAGTIERMLAYIDALSPEYSASAREYFAGDRQRGFCCYIMKKALFCRMCEFQFPILLAMDAEWDGRGRPASMQRMPGYVGEMLYGIFIHHLLHREHWRVKTLQLVLFDEVRRGLPPANRFRFVLSWRAKRAFRAFFGVFFPKGTARRERIKRFYYSRIGGRAVPGQPAAQNEINENNGRLS